MATAEQNETLSQAYPTDSSEENRAPNSAADPRLDVLVIGAGPTGLACAIDAQRLGLRVALVDKGCLCNSLFHYPAHMTFFTTSELLEIGGIPFPSPNSKPTRNEALEYYRKVAAHFHLDVRQYQRVERVERIEHVGGADSAESAFRIYLRDRFARPSSIEARKLIVATGYYDLPNTMGIPGEELPKVHHYYNDPHPYSGQDVLVIGGKNSAAIAALELWRHGARVTLVHRGPEIHRHVKYWIKPDIENRIKNGEIAAHFHSRVTQIDLDEVKLETPAGKLRLKNDFVFALTGYHPDYDFLASLGVEQKGPDRLPACNPETLESNVPGIYLAGVIVAGARTNEIFIENGRFHGELIARHLAQQNLRAGH